VHRSIAFAAALCALAPDSAFAHPRIASDGIYIGARLEPGVAAAAAYDLDIYLTGDRFVSLGPAVSFSGLGEEGVDQGRRQEYLFAVDVLRVKVALNGGTDWVRPYLLAGGGFYYASLPEQRSAPRDVFLVPDGTAAVAELRYGALGVWGGLASVGAGADFYVVDSFALGLVLVAHVRLDDQERMPRFWSEALVGVRFGV
jgi:hypothetical protein